MEIIKDEGAVYWLRHIEDRLRRWTKDIEDHTQSLRKANYNRNQPRVPAGQTTGGQWTSGGGGRFGTGILKPSRNPILRVISDDEEEEVSPYTTHPYNPMRRDTYIAPTKPTSTNLGLTESELEVEKIKVRELAKPHLEAARKIPSGVTEVSEGETDLTTGQKISLKKFRSERSRYANNVVITNYSDGRTVFSVEKPADNIPGSFAVWETQVDATGSTIARYKTTIGPKGEFIHTKNYNK